MREIPEYDASGGLWNLKALRTEPIISAWCAVAEVEDAQRRKAEDYAEFPPETEWTERLPC